ncbi:TetR/AcrR family transcriptional regulator [Cohnella panacarvi]|uniref:TetR/AcrR family transcriptional regulator n=1 Tax=Cohnella panacarvi TaxID=400776 RepID=UPI00047A2958|nr:TetR/AcrR family transcriptional regulator [Cohnella panacarvi]
MPRVSKSPEERRNELVDAAEALFSEKGYFLTAVSDIVRRVGVSQGAFYYYFKSKAEIADALVQRIVERVFALFAEGVDRPDLTPTEKLSRLFELDRHGFNHEEGMGALYHHLHSEENTFLHQKLISRIIERFAPMVAQLIDQGKEEGAFRTGQNALYLAEFLLTGYQFWTDSAFFERSEEERLRRLASIGGFVEALLVANPNTIRIGT